MVTRQIVWENQAKSDLKRIIYQLQEYSWSTADDFLTTLLERIDQLVEFPERYSPDRFKLDNDGSYRAFEYKFIRISYRVTEKQIRILIVRPTKMKPKYH